MKLSRLVLGAVLLSLVVLTLGALVYQRTFAARPAEPLGRVEPRALTPAPAALLPPDAGAPPAAELGVVVVNVQGSVERSTGDRWSPVHPGDHLAADESVRTGAASRADLQVDEKSRLSITDASELKVREVTSATHRFKLVQGRISVDYAANGSRLLKIEGDVGDAAAITKGARFSVLSSGKALTVATETGSVDLHAADRTVIVAAGTESIVRPGEAPSVAVPIPVALLLKVADAGKAAPDAALCANVTGQVSPGASVVVDGRAAPVGPDGVFQARVARREGLEKVLVSSRDAVGHVREESIPCARRKRNSQLNNFRVNWE